MKILKYFTSVVVLSILFTSCYNDDTTDYLNIDPSVTRNLVTATIATSSTTTAEEALLGYTVTLDQTFESDATLVVRVDLVDARFLTDEVILPAGANSVSSSLFLPADDGNNSATSLSSKVGFGAITVSGIIVNDAPEGVQYDLESNTISLDFIDMLPEIDTEGFSILLDWSGAPGNDIDLQVIDAAFTFFAINSGTGSRYEQGVVSNENPDGGYDVYLLVFDPDNANTLEAIDYTVYGADSTDEDPYTSLSGTLAIGTETNVRVPVASFTKTTNADGESTYSDFSPF